MFGADSFDGCDYTDRKHTPPVTNICSDTIIRGGYYKVIETEEIADEYFRAKGHGNRGR